MTALEARTLIVRDALLHVTRSRTIRGDVVAADGVLTQVGSKQQIDLCDGLVLEASGASVVPILIDSAIDAQGRGTDLELAIGRSAVFVVIRGTVPTSRIGEMLIVNSRDVLAVVLEDRVVTWDGLVAGPGDPSPNWVGAWTDARRGMTQFLTQDGRYSETRGGHTDAYTGRFWAHRQWVAYLDDTGFWAFGQKAEGALYHGGFVLRRTPIRPSLEPFPSKPKRSCTDP
ncbi:Atu4866 domain-containing protein [Plantibacter sp. Mn2098]|uniref:Atu4866 domain-containing protein n=1 Tax=Plantibacter sp. Mn2098 TaxID=3395266 RepID=UPI003BDEFCE1